MKSELLAFRDAAKYSKSVRPWGAAVMSGRYNEDGRKKRKCVDCKREYAPTSGPQKRCAECRKSG